MKDHTTAETSPASTRWERVAESAWGQYISGVQRHLISYAQARATTGRDALEIGPDGGRWSRMLADVGWQMTCIDVNPEALELCQQRIPEANCIQADTRDTSLPVSSDAFDLQLCIEVGPVIQSDWILAESFRVLKPGGIFVGIFWNRNSLRGLFSDATCRLRSEFSFYSQAYLPWRRKLLAQGFEMIHEEGLCWFPFPRQSNSPLIPACVELERALGLNRLIRFSPWVMFIAEKRV